MIRRLACYVVNSICCLMYRKEYREFIWILDADNEEEARKAIDKVQEEKLFQILRINQSCEFGRRYDFNNLRTVAEYQEQVPLSVYDDYVKDIDKIKTGKPNILTEEEVLLLQPSSGSTSAFKLIPYTDGLKAEFQKGIRPWIYDLYRNIPGIKWGRSYWSITPVATRVKYHEYGVPVGFGDDKAYFGSWENKFFNLIFAVPSSVARANTMEEFYHQTALRLLDCPDLTLISIWNPSFFLLLLEYIENNSERLTQEIMRHNKRRGADVQRILGDRDYDKLWKRLKVISCWADTNARVYSDKLQGYFPNVTIQPKGLLATEGFVSFPLFGAVGSVLSLNSHFFEFLSIDDNKIYLASELQQAQEYAVILTTSGGLYRYQLKDVIRVSGFAGSVPLIQFIGKQDSVSDLFGEKLNERFVELALEQIGQRTEFSMLAPETDHYVLYTRFNEKLQSFEDDSPNTLANRIEEKLRENFHYDYCRRLGQLKAVQVFQLTGRPDREYLDECVKRGQRLGDIKPVALHLQGGWNRVFEGNLL